MERFDFPSSAVPNCTPNVFFILRPLRGFSLTDVRAGRWPHTAHAKATIEVRTEALHPRRPMGITYRYNDSNVPLFGRFSIREARM